jgi:cathepsin L
MKVIAVALASAAVVSAYPLQEFAEWSGVHAKQYDSEHEYRMRYAIWKTNMDSIDEFNKGNHTFTVGMNQFGDLTPREFASQFNTYKAGMKSSHELHERTVSTIPSNVDWRKQGLVTGVKNQGQCGSCYSFSATGSIEGQWAKAYKLISLTEQQAVDCSQRYGNNGCNGGLMDNVFRYYESFGGIMTEADYPYMHVQQRCKADKSKVAAKITGWKDIRRGDEHSLTEAIATVGPVSVAIDASQFSFQFYKRGVYDEPHCSSSALDHGVLVVGYGTEGGAGYYLVKNSWGTGWGDAGYIKMTRNGHNQCGIATQASYPTV